MPDISRVQRKKKNDLSLLVQPPISLVGSLLIANQQSLPHPSTTSLNYDSGDEAKCQFALPLAAGRNTAECKFLSFLCMCEHGRVSSHDLLPV